MPVVEIAATGKTGWVTEEDAAAGIKSGVYKPVGKVLAQTSTGEQYAVEAAEGLASRGLEAAGGADVAALAQEQADEVLAGGGSGVARAAYQGLQDSLFLGLPSALAGAERREEIRRLRREQETAYQGARLVTDVATGIVGASKGALGRAVSLAPSGAVTRLSERIVAGGVAGSRTLGAAAGGAIEGAAGAAADYLADQAITEKPGLSGEAFAASLGTGALLGGAIGGTLGGIGSAIERRGARRGAAQLGRAADDVADGAVDVERAAMAAVDDLAAESDRIPLSSLIPPRAATPEGVAERVSGVYGALRQADAERVTLQSQIDDTVLPGLGTLPAEQADALRGELATATRAYQDALKDAKGWASGVDRQAREAERAHRNAAWAAGRMEAQQAKDAQRAIRALDADARAEMRQRVQQERDAMRAVRDLVRDGRMEAKDARRIEREAARLQKMATKAPSASSPAGALTEYEEVTVADLLAASRRFGSELENVPSVSPERLSLAGVINEGGELVDGNHRAAGLRAWAGDDPGRMEARVRVVRTRDNDLVRGILDAKDAGRDNIDALIDQAMARSAKPAPDVASAKPKRTGPQPETPEFFAASKATKGRFRISGLPTPDDVDGDVLYIVAPSDLRARLVDTTASADELERSRSMYKRGRDFEPPTATLRADGSLDLDDRGRSIVTAFDDAGDGEGIAIVIRMDPAAKPATKAVPRDDLLQQLQRTQERVTGGAKLGDVSAEGAAAAPKKRTRQPKLPAGFQEGANIAPGTRRIKGLPTLDELNEDALYVVKASDLRSRGNAGLQSGIDEGRKASIQRGWKDGKSFDPIDVTLWGDGRVEVAQGRHRLWAAAEEGRDIPVRFSRGIEEPKVTGKDAVSEFLAKYKRRDQRFVSSFTGGSAGPRPGAVDRIVTPLGPPEEALPPPLDLASFRRVDEGEPAAILASERGRDKDLDRILLDLRREGHQADDAARKAAAEAPPSPVDKPLSPGAEQMGRVLDGDSDDALEVFARLDEAAEQMRRAVERAQAAPAQGGAGVVNLPEPPAAAGQGIVGKVMGAAQNVGSAMEVANALGVPVPSAAGIPVIGPALSSYLKLRAAWRTLRGTSARLPATPAAKAAAARVRIEAAAKASVSRVLELGESALTSSTLPGLGARQAGRLASQLVDREAEQREMRDEIDQAMQATPDAVQVQVAQASIGIPIEVTQAAQDSAVRAAMYLQSVAPQPPGAGTPWASEPRYTATQIAQWRQRHTAVKQPVAVATAMASGLSAPWAKEALVQVWPEIWGMWREELSRQQDVLARLSRGQRMAIGASFDVALDPSQLATYPRAAGATPSTATQAPSPAMPTRSPRPSVKPRAAEIYATAEQQGAIQ